jgi:hypothetical protein
MNRRQVMRGAVSLGLGGWLAQLARGVESSRPKRSCILLWMSGGPSQIDTFDPKPGHANGGPFKAIQTATPGIQIAEHLPKVAAKMKHLAIVRSMSTKQGDHGRATFHVRTGYNPQGPIEFPAFGALVAHERDQPGAALPGYVGIGSAQLVGSAASSPGFLGPRFAPLAVGTQEGENIYRTNETGTIRVQDLDRPARVSADRQGERVNLLRDLEAEFLATRPGPGTSSHTAAYDQAIRMMSPEAAKAFDLSDEPAKMRDAYGRNRFGDGCLLARRLIERRVPFVEVALGGWDTHDSNFTQVARLCHTLDPAWATLLGDLEQRGLLKDTVVVWMGEFGRTPGINPRQGRDHFPAAWSAVLGGGGIQGGSVLGKTSADGVSVEEKPVGVPDFLATLSLALGIDPLKQNMTPVGRPIRVVDPVAKPLTEVLA